jgi:flagellar motor switch protein FliN/FliY
MTELNEQSSNEVVPAPAPTPAAPKQNGPKPQTSLEMLMDVPLQISVELGRSQMTLRQTLELVQGSVIELDRLAGDPVDIFVNERLLAKGEVVVVDDKFAVRITELIDPKANKKAE